VPTPRVTLIIATTVVVGILLYAARDALSPFVIGLLLIYLLDPMSSVQESLAQLKAWYESVDLPPEVRAAIDQALASGSQGAGSLDFGALLPIARTVLGTATGFLGFLIIPIWAFYILRDRVSLTNSFADSLPHAWRDEVWAVLSIVERVVGRWIRAQLLLGLVVGVATFGGLILLGILIDPRFTQFAVLLAVIAGVFELLPIIGPIISMIPTLLIALTTHDPVLAAIAVVILYLVVQQVEGAVLVPKIQGSAVDMHPSLVIFVLIVGGSIAGLLGAILAIPITAAGRDVYRYLFRRLSDTDAGAALDPAADTTPGTDPPLEIDEGPIEASPPHAPESSDQPADPQQKE